MNKCALLPDAPCNAWFGRFPNVLLYRGPAEFSAALAAALAQDPPPLSGAHLRCGCHGDGGNSEKKTAHQKPLLLFCFNDNRSDCACRRVDW